MKNSLNKLVILLLAFVTGVACTEHTEYNDAGFSEVSKLLYPSQGDALDLIEQADANIYFEWQVSKMGTPAYTVVFLNDQKQEVGRYLSDNNGQKASLKMLHSTLNTVAAEAGIASMQTGDIYWTVCASLGGVEIISSDEPHKLTVKRYASVAAPYHLYVTGEGSEFGADPANAKRLRELGNGRFEIYTKFNGSFNFINRNAEGAKLTYGVADGRITEGAEATATADGIYCVTLDFPKGTVKMEKIENLTYWWCSTPDASKVLAYAGNGVWKIKTTVPTGDNRYRFNATVDGKDEIWGYKNSGHDPDPTILTGADYYITRRVRGSIDQWGYPFKFISPLKGIETTLVVDMSPEAETYNQWFEFNFAPEATPVTLKSPAMDSSFELSGVAGSKVNFAWNKLPDTDAGKLTTYTVIYYSDAAMKKEVGRKDAQGNGSIDVSHTDLEAYANSAGIPEEGTGEIYWAVQSKLISWTAISGVWKFSVIRMKGIPKAAYISGAATEFGASYQKLKSKGAGEFEIYTKLKAGTYNITDGNTPAARNYVITDGKLVQGPGNITATGENIYCITLNFASGETKFEKITNVRYLSPNIKTQNTGKQIVMPYQGNGIWYAAEAIPYMRDWDDDRYFFWADVDGVKIKFGAITGMTGDINTAPEERDSRYFITRVADVNSDDAGAFKALHRYRGNDSKRVNIKLNLSPNEENYYTHNEYLD